VNRFDKAWGIVQRANHANLGLIVDSFHTLVLTNDWSSLSDLPGERIFFVQLGDAPRLSVDPLTLRRHHSKLPGEGDFDVPSFLRAVLATEFLVEGIPRDIGIRLCHVRLVVPDEVPS
jgi:4-hydroxyphenylpyruvate dioxygenase